MKGHLRKRGKLWYAVLAVGKDEAGKHRQKWVNTGCSRKEEAERTLRALLDDYERGIVPSTVTVAAFAARWLSVHSIRPSTAVTYRAALDNHILPDLGSIPLQKLSPLAIQEAWQRLGERIQPGTIRTAHAVLHKMLHQAVKWRLLGVNPAAAVTLPRVPRRELRVWSPDEARAFLAQTAGTRYGALYHLALATGMRKGELLGLQWEDIDWQGYIRVRHNLVKQKVEGKTKWVLTTETKPGPSRVIAVGADTIAALRDHQERQDNLRAKLYLPPSSYVFTNEKGERISPCSLDWDLHRHVALAGLPRISPHGLRHTHATMLLMQNVHPKVVQERLGHKRIAITLDIYSHVLPHLQDEVAATVDRLLGANQGGKPPLADS